MSDRETTQVTGRVQTRMVGAQLSRLTENRWTVPSKG